MDSKKQAELLSALGDEYRSNAGGDHSKDNGDNTNNGSNGGSGGDQGGSGSGGSGEEIPAVVPAVIRALGAPGGETDPLAARAVCRGWGAWVIRCRCWGLHWLALALRYRVRWEGRVEVCAGRVSSWHLWLATWPATTAMTTALTTMGRMTTPSQLTSSTTTTVSLMARPANYGQGGGEEGAGNTAQNTPGSWPAAQAQQPAPVAAVPASAGGDPASVVQMPDGTPVTAGSAQHATAMRAVLNGSTVTDAWKQAQVDLPSPGMPVTSPADPSHLTPGEVAQFKTRDPVMYMGNGKIWLDGQLQPQTALPTADFLGWEDPAQQAGVGAAPSPGPKSSATGT